MGGDDFASRDDFSSVLSYLTEGFCDRCTSLLETRLQNLKLNGTIKGMSSLEICSNHTSTSWGSTTKTPLKLSNSSPVLNNQQPQRSVENSKSDMSLLGDNESDERLRLSQVGRKKDFTHIERVDGKQVNVLKGLELHTKVFNPTEQKKIVDFVYSLQEKGRAGKLRERTYSEPSKWKRGKGRVTLQFGCCYNYAVDKQGNPPGIIREEDVDPLPPMFKAMIKRLVRWNVLPPNCVPNSCIVNMYDEGDCIPPHIDHHDFVRPFCTVSFLTECNILFGAHLKVMGDGEFAGPVSIPLPVGSVLILNGNGADVAKHCVPGVPSKRISITFRKMDESKLPYNFLPDPELRGLQPLSRSTMNNSSPVMQVRAPQTPQSANGNRTMNTESQGFAGGRTASNNNPLNLGRDDFPPLNFGKDDFPSLGSSNKANKNQKSR